jgi:hypothetical protein
VRVRVRVRVGESMKKPVARTKDIMGEKRVNDYVKIKPNKVEKFNQKSMKKRKKLILAAI